MFGIAFLTFRNRLPSSLHRFFQQKHMPTSQFKYCSFAPTYSANNQQGPLCLRVLLGVFPSSWEKGSGWTCICCARGDVRLFCFKTTFKHDLRHQLNLSLPRRQKSNLPSRFPKKLPACVRLCIPLGHT